MSIIKERIKFNNEDVILKINLGIGNNLSGYQQEIDELTEDTKEELINPVIDYEVDRFQYNSSNETTTLTFYFTPDSSSADNTFLTNGAGFSETEINSESLVVLNSFFIMDFYDVFDNYTQTKIFTIYNTKILDSVVSGSYPIPTYEIDNVNNANQFYYWYIPKEFIEAQTGSTVTGYVKFSFYNAKLGRVSLFYNQANAGLKTPEKMYIEATLNLNTMTWEFNSDAVTFFELPSNYAYVSKVNDAVDNFDNLQQNPPTGVFNPEDGLYD